MNTIKRLSFSTATLNLIFTVALVAFYNQSLWAVLILNHPLKLFSDYLFIASFFVFLVALLNLFLSLITAKYILKPVLISLIISAAFASYFMSTYGIVYDKTMIQNTLETDSHEVLDLLSGSLFLHLFWYGLLPSLLIATVKVNYSSLLRELKLKLLIIISCIILIAANFAAFYKDYSSTFRNQREIRNIIIPTSYIYYTLKHFSGAYEQRNTPFKRIAADAKMADAWSEKTQRTVTVIVVGETARAMNFSLNGYPRQTNPKLAEMTLTNFTNVSSCGTSTAVSLPCMFSNLARSDFDVWEAKNSENLLDILNNVGFDVLWRDNNSGCKGVCDRVNTQALTLYKSESSCEGSRCFDEVMLDNLDDYLDSSEKDVVLVLHQLGSHGPAYSKRYPTRFRQFTPTCENSNLSACSQKEIVNSYDNSILYTDYFLSKVVEFLQQRTEKYASAMLYISDHGESLGENNLYLHGLPYYMAPKTQTSVPFLAWFSKQYQQQLAVDTQCLSAKQQQEISHDNLFHSMLGLLKVETKVYDQALDIFASCQKK